MVCWQAVWAVVFWSMRRQQLAQKMLAEGQNCCLVEFSSQGTGTGAMAACGGTVTLFLQRGEAMQ